MSATEARAARSPRRRRAFRPRAGRPVRRPREARIGLRDAGADGGQGLRRVAAGRACARRDRAAAAALQGHRRTAPPCGRPTNRCGRRSACGRRRHGDERPARCARPALRGRWLAAAGRHCFSPESFERLVEPALADLQLEDSGRARRVRGRLRDGVDRHGGGVRPAASPSARARSSATTSSSRSPALDPAAHRALGVDGRAAARPRRPGASEERDRVGVGRGSRRRRSWRSSSVAGAVPAARGGFAAPDARRRRRRTSRSRCGSSNDRRARATAAAAASKPAA